jgi:hypothetical protein
LLLSETIELLLIHCHPVNGDEEFEKKVSKLPKNLSSKELSLDWHRLSPSPT